MVYSEDPTSRECTVANKQLRITRVIGATLMVIASSRPAIAQQPVHDGVVSSGALSFDARANVGDFVGTTNEVSGRLIGGADLTSARGWVEVPVTSLKTGNDHRDRDLNKSMASDRYPTLRFDLTSITKPRDAQSDSVDATLHGTFSAHGVTRDVDVPVAIALGPDSTMVRGQFPLNLRDFQIGGLAKFLGIFKMDEHILVHIALAFRPTNPTSASVMP